MYKRILFFFYKTAPNAIKKIRKMIPFPFFERDFPEEWKLSIGIQLSREDFMCHYKTTILFVKDVPFFTSFLFAAAFASIHVAEPLNRHSSLLLIV